jgi:hypothetical protein
MLQINIIIHSFDTSLISEEIINKEGQISREDEVFW